MCNLYFSNKPYAYLKMLGRLNLTPAPPLGLQPQAEPDGDGEQPKEPRQENTQGKPSGEKPVGKPQKGNITYIVRNLRVNKGIKSTNTQLVLESDQGERVDAFARGEHPELAAGIALVDVKLEKRQQDTVVYYMLEKFKVTDIQPQAA